MNERAVELHDDVADTTFADTRLSWPAVDVAGLSVDVTGPCDVAMRDLSAQSPTEST